MSSGSGGVLPRAPQGTGAERWTDRSDRSDRSDRYQCTAEYPDRALDVLRAITPYPSAEDAVRYFLQRATCADKCDWSR
ncbi:hypothetical protein ACFC1R_20690 [Kitasatospora sp. NPDC056138]|uniref:hypothetical protein n=1 Tax=Kitasatospora sp. NPDC056138 TaxID=3345724 RepID=UPI0035DF5F8C